MGTAILIVLGIIAYLTIARLIVIWYDNKYKILNNITAYEFELWMCTIFFPVFVIYHSVIRLSAFFIKSKWKQ